METINRKSNSEIIKEAREAFKGQWGNVIVAYLLCVLVSAAIYGTIFLAIGIVVGVITLVFSSTIVSLLTFVLSLIGFLVSFLFQGRIWNWQYNFILKKSRGELISNTDFKTVFNGLAGIQDLKTFFLNKDNVVRNLYPALTLLFSTVAILIGFVFLIIPGIVLGFMFALVPFLSVEHNEMSPVDVLKKSSSLMEGYKLKLFRCYIQLIPLAILCIIPLGLGLLWFIPFTSFVMAKFYDAHRE